MPRSVPCPCKAMVGCMMCNDDGGSCIRVSFVSAVLQRAVREYAQLVQAARAEAGEAATYLTTVRQELEDTRKAISFLEGQVRVVYIASTPLSTDAMRVCIVITLLFPCWRSGMRCKRALRKRRLSGRTWLLPAPRSCRARTTTWSGSALLWPRRPLRETG
jgi:hypothetical protein